MFIGKIFAAPDTDQWVKPKCHCDDLQYSKAGYGDQMEIDNAVNAYA
jgi:hypothetical protein